MPADDDHRRRKALGAWYTPAEVVDRLVAALFTDIWLSERAGRTVRVLDPACGDGRFLAAAAQRLASHGLDYELVGVDVDRRAVALARTEVPRARIVHDDALRRAWHAPDRGGFDAVVGNPPFLTPLSAANDVARRYGGPLADAAAEFLGLAGDLVTAEGGRIGFVLPRSILATRDAGPVRRRIDAIADVIWSAPGSATDFDAQVDTISLVFDTTRPKSGADLPESGDEWSRLAAAGVPPLPSMAVAGTLGDRAQLSAGFRDEYYGLVPAVGDDVDGPPLVTSGLIDPGHCWWGRRPVRFARTRFDHPRVDLARLDARMHAWVTERLTPKVLIANQTAIVEAVVDGGGRWVPAVPVLTAHPTGRATTDEIAAVLTSPIASAWLWHRHAGSGLSARAVRLSPSLLRELPWPAGALGPALGALAAGDLRGCGTAILDAYGATAGDGDALLTWWSTACDRIARRAAAAAPAVGSVDEPATVSPSSVGGSATRASQRSSTTG